MLASSGGFSCNLWSAKNNYNSLVEEMKNHEHGLEVECVDISADGKLVASGSRDGKVSWLRRLVKESRLMFGVFCL